MSRSGKTDDIEEDIQHCWEDQERGKEEQNHQVWGKENRESGCALQFSLKGAT